MPLLDRLVIVAGHAVLRNPALPHLDSSWFLLPYQHGEGSSYQAHVRAGVELAAAEPGAALIFSGGPSRTESGPLSEAQSYALLAEHQDWFGYPEVRTRTLSEERARDSFENLLFSLARFKEFTGRYPVHLTMVSWAFKEKRFHLFRSLIRWPRERYTYCGPNDPPQVAASIAAEERTLALYQADPYSAGAELRAKRELRNPQRNFHGYLLSCPELAGLMTHQGPELFAGPLPWD